MVYIKRMTLDVFFLIKDFSLIFGYESRINNGTLELHHKMELTNIQLEKKDIEFEEFIEQI